MRFNMTVSNWRCYVSHPNTLVLNVLLSEIKSINQSMVTLSFNLMVLNWSKLSEMFHHFPSCPSQESSCQDWLIFLWLSLPYISNYQIFWSFTFCLPVCPNSSAHIATMPVLDTIISSYLTWITAKACYNCSHFLQLTSPKHIWVIFLKCNPCKDIF